MKTKQIVLLIVSIAFLNMSGCKKKKTASDENQDPNQIPGYELIAYYPFTTDCKEANGKNNDFTCVNVQHGNNGVYLNGVYFYDNNGNGSKAEVNLSGFNPDDFIIEFEYLAEEDFKPVFVGGTSYRWLYLYTYNGNLRLSIFMRNGNFDDQIIETGTPLNTMRKIKIRYKKSDNRSIKVFINDNEIKSYNLPEDLDTRNELIFGSNHFGYGNNFKGYWRNMKFYKAE